MKRNIQLSSILFLIISILVITKTTNAQVDTTKFRRAELDSSKHIGWIPKGIVGFRMTQVALSNWQTGGENLLQFSGYTDLGADHYSRKFIFKNKLRADVGSSKTGDAEYKTNDNSLSLENLLIYRIKSVIQPFVSNEIRTGVLNGYDYKKEPKEQTSAFFDPGYITQTIGMIYDKPHISSRLGIAFQETFTNKFRQYSDDEKTADKKEAFRFQTGIESVTDAYTTIAKNVYIGTRLRLFSAFDELDVWDVHWDNTIALKVNDFIFVNINAVLVYEKKQSPKTQFKEGLNIGLAYTFF